MNIIYTHSYLFGGHWECYECCCLEAGDIVAGSMYTTIQEVNFIYGHEGWTARGVCEHYKN